MASRKAVQEALRAHKSFLKFAGGKSLWQGLFPDDEPVSPPLDWNNLSLREIAANRVLRVEHSDYALRRAFNEFGLDPDNPFEWRYLMTVLVEIHYGKGKKCGPKLKWDSNRWCTLLADFREIKSNKPDLGELAVCRAIIRRFGSRYEEIVPSTLRRQLINARDLNQNDLLREMYDVCSRRIENELLDREENYEECQLAKVAYDIALDLVSRRCAIIT